MKRESGWKGADYMARVVPVSMTVWENGKNKSWEEFWLDGTELVCFPHFDYPGKWAYPIPYKWHPGEFVKHMNN